MEILPRNLAKTERQEHIRTVFNTVARITELHGQPLYDETVDLGEATQENPEVMHRQLGRIASIHDEEKGISNGEVLVATYTDTELAVKHSQMVSEEIGLNLDLIGHIEFRRNIERSAHTVASTEGIFYLTKDGDILLKLTTELEPDDLLSEESEQCFNLAQELGIGVRFAHALYGHAEDVSKVTSQNMIGSVEALSLGKFLRRYISP